jgi:hypothetical protein
VRFSPSQIDLGKKCQRKQAFKYFARLEVEVPDWMRKAREDGELLHKHGENYLKDGTYPPNDKMGRLVQKAISMGLLPEPPITQVESWVSHDWSEGIQFFARVDFEDEHGPNDHKTCKDQATYEKYNLDEEGMRTDPQVVINSWLWLEKHPEAVQCRARWIYYLKKGGDPFAVEVVLSREEVQRTMETEIVPVAEHLSELKRLWDEINPQTLDEKISLCNVVKNEPKACGGKGQLCDFFQHCKMYQKPKEEDLMPSIASLLNKSNGNQSLVRPLEESIQAHEKANGERKAVEKSGLSIKDQIAKLEAEHGQVLPPESKQALDNPAPPPTPAPVAEKTRRTVGRQRTQVTETVAPNAAPIVERTTFGVDEVSKLPLSVLIEAIETQTGLTATLTLGR